MVEPLASQPEGAKFLSELSPMNRIGKPHEIRGVALWLASDASSFCTGSEYVCALRIIPSTNFSATVYLLPVAITLGDQSNSMTNYN
jgi:hypothetical protein